MKVILTKRLDPNYLVMPGYQVIRSDELSNYDRGELESLILNDYIDYCKEPVQTLIDLAALVAHGGDIQVSGLNLRAVARSLSDRLTDVAGTVKLLYRAAPGSNAVQSATDIHVVIATLESRGFKIMEKHLEGDFYTVRAIRS